MHAVCPEYLRTYPAVVAICHAAHNVGMRSV